jgi:hypothetical protein
MHDADAVEALTAQVNELARICARLSRENGELRSHVAELSAGQSPAEVPAARPALAEPSRRTGPAGLGVSRRTVGVALAGAAAGVVGATVLGDRGGAQAAAAGVTGHDLRTAAGRAAAGGQATEETEYAGQAASAADEETTAAAPTSTGSIINGTLSTASGVLSGNNTATGPGISGASKSGRGGVFSGSAAAQIQLVPGGSSHPKSGKRGDLYADSKGRLWFCKSTGSRATWHQIA